MLLCIPELFTKEEVKNIRAKIEDSSLWIDGNETSGAQAATAKHNKQLPSKSALKAEIGDQILDALGSHELFISAALPLKIIPPLFNRYDEGDDFGIHVDNAIRPIRGTHHRIRSDLSMTIFFSEPEEYDGGELIIETNFGAQEVKLEAGSAVLYPSTSLHKVTKITRGSRISSFLWIQSMIRDEGQRTILFDLDQTIQRLTSEIGINHPEVIRLTGIYHNIVRRWADA